MLSWLEAPRITYQAVLAVASWAAAGREGAGTVQPSRHAVIASTALFTPPDAVSNAELVEAFNAWAVMANAENAESIARGELEPIPMSSVEFIEKASGVKSRYVVDKTGVLDPQLKRPIIPERSNDELSVLAEMAVEAARQALERWGKP